MRFRNNSQNFHAFLRPIGKPTKILYNEQFRLLVLLFWKQSLTSFYSRWIYEKMPHNEPRYDVLVLFQLTSVSAQVTLYTYYPSRGMINVTQCYPPTQTTVLSSYDLKISNPFQTILNANDFLLDTSMVICSPPTKSDFFETWESYMQFK